jgi:hypothetical protein
MIRKYFSSDVHTFKKTTNHESSEKLKEQKKELPSRWLKMVAALGNNSLSLALHCPLTIGLTSYCSASDASSTTCSLLPLSVLFSALRM